MISLDWYHESLYSRSPSVNPENTAEIDLSRLRSGSFHSSGSSLTDEESNSIHATQQGNLRDDLAAGKFKPEKIHQLCDTAVPVGRSF